MLAAGSPALFDDINEIEVELLHGGMALAGADDAALFGGANLALLGDELVQFGGAAQTGARHYRLSHLLRGRHGSEWAIGGHAAGERFVLLEPARLQRIDIAASAIGAPATVSAIGPGDGGVAVTAATGVIGRALRPPAPVGLVAETLDDGTICFGWTRRSRTGWAWLDGADAPLGEDGERYRLEISPSAGAARAVELTAPGYDYGPAEQAADGAVGAASVTIAVSQLGTRAPSLPAVTATWLF